MTHADPISMRLRLASRLLDLSRPPAGWGGAPTTLTSAQVMGFGVALGAILRAAQAAEDGLQEEERRALLAQGIAALMAEFLAAAPVALRGRLAATLQLMALEGAEQFDAELEEMNRAGQS
jgi:hypothetical protein